MLRGKMKIIVELLILLLMTSTVMADRIDVTGGGVGGTIVGDIDIYDDTPHLRFVPTAGNQYEFYVYDSELFCVDVTTGKIVWRMKSNEVFSFDDNDVITTGLGTFNKLHLTSTAATDYDDFLFDNRYFMFQGTYAGPVDWIAIDYAAPAGKGLLQSYWADGGDGAWSPYLQFLIDEDEISWNASGPLGIFMADVIGETEEDQHLVFQSDGVTAEITTAVTGGGTCDLELTGSSGTVQVSSDLDIDDDTPHLTFRDTDDDSAFQLHYDATATYPFSLFKGTDDGTGFNVNPSTPAIGVLASNKVIFGIDNIIESSPSVPATSSTACTAGERAWDSSYEYRCVDTNNWKRIALATWSDVVTDRLLLDDGTSHLLLDDGTSKLLIR